MCLATLWLALKFQLGTIYAWAPYIPMLCIISGIAQCLEHNNISLLGCQLLTFPMGYATVQGTFFLSPSFQKRSFLERKSQFGLKHFKVLKFQPKCTKFENISKNGW